MNILDRLVDPWAIALGTSSGAFFGVVAAATFGPLSAVPVAVAAAVAGWAAKVSYSGLTRPRPPASELPQGAAAIWCRRAGKAVRTLHQQTLSPRDPVLRTRIADIDDRAAGVLADLHALAVQASKVQRARGQMSGRWLRQEQERLGRAVAAVPDPAVQVELRRTLEAVQAQLAVHQRLREAETVLFARLEATTYGLESLVVRLAEYLVLAETVGPDVRSGQLAELAGDLDVMRIGLVEAQQVSTRRLEAGSG